MIISPSRMKPTDCVFFLLIREISFMACTISPCIFSNHVKCVGLASKLQKHPISADNVIKSVSHIPIVHLQNPRIKLRIAN